MASARRAGSRLSLSLGELLAMPTISRAKSALAAARRQVLLGSEDDERWRAVAPGEDLSDWCLPSTPSVRAWNYRADWDASGCLRGDAVGWVNEIGGWRLYVCMCMYVRKALMGGIGGRGWAIREEEKTSDGTIVRAREMQRERREKSTGEIEKTRREGELEREM